MANNVDTLIVKFQNEISNKEIAMFRGAVLNYIPEEVNVLFHNHVGDGFRYSYPLIQYKRIQGKAAIVCVNEGASAFKQFLDKFSFHFKLGDEREEDFVVDNIQPKSDEVVIDDNRHYYHLNRWLPFNEENYKEYCSLETIIEKTEFMQRILVGNILSFASGLGIRIENQIVCGLISIDRSYLTFNKGVQLETFDLTFRANINLPVYIGIGKHASIGFGIITKSKR